MGWGAFCTSPSPFSNICQVRARLAMESPSASARPITLSASGTTGSSATTGVILTRVSQWVRSRRSPITHSASAPAA